jgi:cation diffusion facilitator CzcD-associated flavoprotein CzcO
MPYLPYVPSLVPPLRYSQCQNRRFPPTWPVYAPARKLANWLESYASSLDLNVWTSSTVINARPDASGSKWTVAINRPDGERVFKEVRHVVFATGLGSGDEGMKLPVYPGMVSDAFILFSISLFPWGADNMPTTQEIFKGEMLHSSRHKRALDHKGKKVVIVGACTSGVYPFPTSLSKTYSN